MGNPTSNTILEWIHLVLGNLVWNFNISETYVEKYDLWSGILAAAAFAIRSTANRLKGYSTGLLVFFRYTILPIEHKADRELIRQIYQKQINKDITIKNINKVYHDYQVGDKLILNNNAAFKYKTSYKGPFVITQCWTNGTFILHCVKKKVGIIYVALNHIHLIQTLNILTLKKKYDNSQHMITSYILLYYIKACKQGI